MRSETCRIFECSSRSLMRWIKKFKTSQSIDRKGRVNVAYKINQQHINQILSILKDKTITMEDLLKKIQIKYPHFNISRVYLGIILDNLKLIINNLKLIVNISIIIYFISFQ